MVNEKTLKREYGGKDWIVLCKKQGALRKMNKPKPQHFAEVKLLWYCPYYVFRKRNRVMISSGSKHDKGGVFLTHRRVLEQHARLEVILRGV
jgi:hypothetical protein